MKNFFSLIKERLLAIVVGSLLLWTTDFIFYQIQSSEKFPRPIRHLFICFLINFFVSFAFSQKGYSVFILLFSFFGFFQMIAVSYFGSFLTPVMIFLFFKDAGEVLETFLGVWKTLWLPTLLQFTAILVFYKFYKTSINKFWSSYKNQKIIKYLLLLVLIYPPLRTVVTGHTFGKQAVNSDLGFVNFYGTLSYFFAKVLPQKLNAKTVNSISPFQVIINDKKPKRHLIFILGESLALKHLQLFGYNKETTPHLVEFEKENKIIKRKAISGGVSTDVAIPLLIHGATPGEQASAQISSQNNCLFKLAKENGFETSFYSIQPQHELKHIVNFLCPKYIDHFEIEKSENGEVLDSRLLEYEKLVDWSKPQFIIFHQRGSHSPYETRYPAENAFFKDQNFKDEKEKQIQFYDNSVRYTDEVIFRLLQQIKESNVRAFERSNNKSNGTSESVIPIEVIMTSDHGEALGENGFWGHVILEPVVAEVPFIYLSDNLKANLVSEDSIKDSWITHQQIFKIITRFLGYKIEEKLSNKIFEVMGPDLDGLAGSMIVEPNETSDSLIKK